MTPSGRRTSSTSRRQRRRRRMTPRCDRRDPPEGGVHAAGGTRARRRLGASCSSTSGAARASRPPRRTRGRTVGACQDFVQLAIALLRTMGIPARYASGYFHPQADAQIGDTVHGESHAWCEAWTGDWWPFDPTNAVAVGGASRARRPRSRLPRRLTAEGHRQRSAIDDAGGLGQLTRHA